MTATSPIISGANDSSSFLKFISPEKNNNPTPQKTFSSFSTPPVPSFSATPVIPPQQQNNSPFSTPSIIPPPQQNNSPFSTVVPPQQASSSQSVIPPQQQNNSSFSTVIPPQQTSSSQSVVTPIISSQQSSPIIPPPQSIIPPQQQNNSPFSSITPQYSSPFATPQQSNSPFSNQFANQPSTQQAFTPSFSPMFQSQENYHNSSIFQQSPSHQNFSPTFSFGGDNNYSQQSSTTTPLFVFDNGQNVGYAPPSTMNFGLMISHSENFTGVVPYSFLVECQQGKTLKKFFGLLQSTNPVACALEFFPKGIFCRQTSQDQRIIVEVSLLEKKLHKYKINGDSSQSPMVLAVDPADGVKKCSAGSVNDTLTIQSIPNEERIYIAINNNQNKGTGFPLIKTYKQRSVNPIDFTGCHRFKITAKSFKETVKSLKTDAKGHPFYLILYSNCCELVVKDKMSTPIHYTMIPDDDQIPTNMLKTIELTDKHISIFSKISSLQPAGSVVSFMYTERDLIVKIESPIDQLGKSKVYLI